MTTVLDEVLPPSLDELIAAIQADQRGENRAGPLTYELAGELAALRYCDVCGRPIVGIDALTQGLLAHYGRQGTPDARLTRALRGTHLETGDTLSPNYCSYHGQITSE